MKKAIRDTASANHSRRNIRPLRPLTPTNLTSHLASLLLAAYTVGMDIRDRVAVVTGGANGLGQAMCTRLAQSGVHVCVADIDSTSGHQLAQQLARAHGVRAIFVRCDVTKPQDLASALQAAQRAFGKPVSIMVNNAYVQQRPRGRSHTCSPSVVLFVADAAVAARRGIGENTHVPWTESHSAWKPVVDVNLSGVIEGTRVAVQHMVEAGVPDGVVLNMSSLAGASLCPCACSHMRCGGTLIHMCADRAQAWSPLAFRPCTRLQSGAWWASLGP